ncbi:MAG: ABC transporter permease, partial [Opitutaceae bacterium]|nr:ABC transporter permease [Opitutaceae bacterium]
MINWLSQILAVTIFALRSIPERLGSVATSAVGIAGVVAVLVGVLSIVAGFRQAVQGNGSPDIAIVMREGADAEMTSILSREDVRLVKDAPGVARGADGALVSGELFVIINLPKRSSGTDANVPLRGVESAAYAVRGKVKILQGRAFEPGRNELIVGVGAARAFAGLDLGRTIRIGVNQWEIVGLFTDGGGQGDSEIWTDAAVLQPAYQRGSSFQSALVRLESVGSFAAFKDALTTNPQLKVKVVRQDEFFAEQSTFTSAFITTIGAGIVVLMACGALFGALNTMYSCVAARAREIATLRALGFGASPVVVSVLVESIVVALVGGAVGATAAYLAFDGFQASTMNFQTFSQVAFAFRVTPPLLVLAV